MGNCVFESAKKYVLELIFIPLNETANTNKVKYEAPSANSRTLYVK